MKVVCWVCKKIIGYVSLNFEEAGIIVGECVDCQKENKYNE